MTMGPTKVRAYSPKRNEHFRSRKYPFDAALLRVSEDAEQLRRNVARLIEQGGEIANESMFQALLSDANRELASLLQDVRKIQDDSLPADGQAGRMKKLVMRAVHCAAKQYMLQAELGNLALTDELTQRLNVGPSDSFGQRFYCARRSKLDRKSRFKNPHAIGRDKSKKPAEDSTGFGETQRRIMVPRFCLSCGNSSLRRSPSRRGGGGDRARLR